MNVEGASGLKKMVTGPMQAYFSGGKDKNNFVEEIKPQKDVEPPVMQSESTYESSSDNEVDEKTIEYLDKVLDDTSVEELMHAYIKWAMREYVSSGATDEKNKILMRYNAKTKDDGVCLEAHYSLHAMFRRVFNYHNMRQRLEYLAINSSINKNESVISFLDHIEKSESICFSPSGDPGKNDSTSVGKRLRSGNQFTVEFLTIKKDKPYMHQIIVSKDVMNILQSYALMYHFNSYLFSMVGPTLDENANTLHDKSTTEDIHRCSDDLLKSVHPMKPIIQSIIDSYVVAENTINTAYIADIENYRAHMKTVGEPATLLKH
jgi:hypothetical protein